MFLAESVGIAVGSGQERDLEKDGEVPFGCPTDIRPYFLRKMSRFMALGWVSCHGFSQSNVKQMCG